MSLIRLESFEPPGGPAAELPHPHEDLENRTAADWAQLTGQQLAFGFLLGIHPTSLDETQEAGQSGVPCLTRKLVSNTNFVTSCGFPMFSPWSDAVVFVVSGRSEPRHRSPATSHPVARCDRSAWRSDRSDWSERVAKDK